MIQKIFLAALAVVALSCGSAPQTEVDPHAGHNHAPGEGHETEKTEAKETGGHEHEGGITVTPEQAKEYGMEWATIEPTDFSAGIRVGGIIEPSTADNYAIVATSAGIVNFEQRGLNVGSSVGRGAKVFALNSEKLAGDNLSVQVRIAKAELEKAQKAFDRNEGLLKDNLITAPQMDDSRASLESAKQLYTSLSQSQSITSPIGGYVTSVDVRNGDFVEQGQVLATVSSGKDLVLRANVTAAYFGDISKVEGANFTTPYNGRTYSVKDLGGRLLSRGSVTEAGSYSVPVRFSFDNRAELVPGSAVEVYLTMRPISGAIVVPVGALTEEQGTYYVYLKTCVDTYQKRAVELGSSNGVDVQILQGLKAGDIVVTKGAYYVRLASKSDAIPHGHAH